MKLNMNPFENDFTGVEITIDQLVSLLDETPGYKNHIIEVLDSRKDELMGINSYFYEVALDLPVIPISSVDNTIADVIGEITENMQNIETLVFPETVIDFYVPIDISKSCYLFLECKEEFHLVKYD